MKASGLNVDQVKAEFTKRIVQFEENVRLLNETLIAIKKENEELRNSLEIVAGNVLDIHHAVFKERSSADANGHERALLTDTRPSESYSGA